MKSAKDITIIALMVAILIGGQLALSMVSGVEVVTVLLLSYTFCFGIKRGMLVATAFSLLRVFIFGFYPTVVILYLVYYNLFAFVIGFIGNKCNHKLTGKNLLILVIVSAILTILFTMFDDIITPIFYGLKGDAFKAYLVYSIKPAITQTVCSIVTVSILSIPIIKCLQKIKM